MISNSGDNISNANAVDHEDDDNAVSMAFINRMLRVLTDKFSVFAPVGNGKALEFAKIKKDTDVLLTDDIPYNSPKISLFPQTEKLLEFKGDEVTDNICVDKNVIFGVKPCDAEALRILSAVFTAGRYPDPYYKSRLDSSYIVAVGCLDKKPGCFCTERGVDMKFTGYCDIMLNRVSKDSYSIKCLSDKGAELIDVVASSLSADVNCSATSCAKNMPNLVADIASISAASVASPLPAATPTAANAAALSTESPAATPTPAVTPTTPTTPPAATPPTATTSVAQKVELSSELDEATLFDAIDWEKASRICQGCGMCSFICPTCHCFNLKDVSIQGETRRYRCWDSCMFPKFTLHASGHNPRSSTKERFRQRVLHKYLYMKKNTGYTACTGCGRCIRSCPVGVNIKKVVEDIMEALS